MKIVQFRKKLYAVSSVALQIPVFQHTRENAGATADPETDALVRYSDVTTSRWQLMIPWITVTKFSEKPTGLEGLFGLQPENEE